MPWPTRGYGMEGLWNITVLILRASPRDKGGCCHGTTVLYHSCCYYYSLISTYMGPALPHITLLPLSYHRNLPQLAALLLTAEQPR